MNRLAAGSGAGHAPGYRGKGGIVQDIPALRSRGAPATFPGPDGRPIIQRINDLPGSAWPRVETSGLERPTRIHYTTGLRRAKVAESVDALALGASGETRESSSLSFRTKCPIDRSVAGTGVRLPPGVYEDVPGVPHVNNPAWDRLIAFINGNNL